MRAITMMVIAMTTFAFADTLIRLASLTGNGATSGQFIVLQSVVGIVMFGWLMKRQHEHISLDYLFDRNIQMRTLGDLMAASAVVTALTILPVGTVSAILQLQPLTVTIAAVVFLGEKVGLHRWSAIIVGLIGGLVIMRPGLEGFDSGTLLVLFGVIGLTIRDIFTRKLESRFSSTSAVVLVSACLFPVGLALHYFFGDGRGIFEIDGLSFLYLAVSSVTGMIAYYILVMAMRIGEVSANAPYRYSRLISAFIVAWLDPGRNAGFLYNSGFDDCGCCRNCCVAARKTTQQSRNDLITILTFVPEISKFHQFEHGSLSLLR